MTFQHPHMLPLLAIPVILAFWEWVRPGHPIVMPFDHGKQRRGHIVHLLVLMANCVPACLLAIGIIFLAHPMTFTPPEVERQLSNIQFLLDTSGSMAENHGSQANGRHRRFDSAMEAIEMLINSRQGDAYGLTIFSRSYIHWLPFTLDTQSIPLSKRFIEPNNPKLDPPSMGRHGLPDELWGITNIGKAIMGTIDMLATRPTGDRMIILMTDGESGDILPPKDVPILNRLRQEQITLFVVLLTNDTIQPQLVQFAHGTGGEAFNAVNSEALLKVFQKIDEMKKVIVLQKQPQVIDWYDPFVKPALGLLGASLLALLGLRFTPW